MRISNMENYKYKDNTNYIEKKLVSQNKEQTARIKKVLDKYGDCKWWLADNYLVRVIGQLNEENMVMNFEDFHKDFQKIVSQNIIFGKLTVSNYALNFTNMIELLKKHIDTKAVNFIIGNDVKKIEDKLKELGKTNILEVLNKEKPVSFIKKYNKKEELLNLSDFIMLESDKKGKCIQDTVKKVKKYRFKAMKLNFKTAKERMENKDSVDFYYANSGKRIDSIFLSTLPEETEENGLTQ